MGADPVSSVRLLRLAVVLLGTLLVQYTIGLDIRVAGVHPDVTWLLPICAALCAGPEAGALVGFCTGLATDLLLPTPFGLSALIGCLLGFATGLATRALDRTVWWLPPLAAAAGSALAVMLYAVLGAVLGQQQFLKVDLGAVVALVTVTNALLSWPAMRVMGWALTADTRTWRAAGSRR
jgi:rod shape-determining protein MreD